MQWKTCFLCHLQPPRPLRRRKADVLSSSVRTTKWSWRRMPKAMRMSLRWTSLRIWHMRSFSEVFFDIMHWCTVVCTYAATDSIHISLISPSRGSVQTFPLCCSRNSLPLRARSPNQRNHGVLPNILVLIVTVVRPYQILGIGFPRVRLHQWRIKVSVVPAGHFPRRAPWKEPCILVEAQPKKEESKMWKCLSEIMRNASQKLKSDANPNGLMFEGNEWSKREEHKLSRG